MLKDALIKYMLFKNFLIKVYHYDTIYEVRKGVVSIGNNVVVST